LFSRVITVFFDEGHCLIPRIASAFARAQASALEAPELFVLS